MIRRIGEYKAMGASSRSTMVDDGGQVRTAHLVQGVAFCEEARLDLKIIEVGNSLCRGLRL
jgi:hypothetical protein